MNVFRPSLSIEKLPIKSVKTFIESRYMTLLRHVSYCKTFRLSFLDTSYIQFDSIFDGKVRGTMEFIPIPYFGMIMSLFVAPLLTYGFIYFLKKNRADVEKMKIRKEIIELELKKDELKYKLLLEENKKYDHLINDN